MIDDLTIRKINDAVNILDVISDFEPNIRRSGVNYTCLCPFHPDRNLGSFFISPKKNMCWCFSCEHGGDAVYYLMKAQGLSYPDALRYLGRKYGIEVEGSEKFKNIPKAKPRDYQLQPMNLPLRFFDDNIYTNTTRNLRHDVFVKWLQSHKWDEAQRDRIERTLKAYRVGTVTTPRHEQFTIFWYSDEDGRLCTGKMIRYHYNGHRMKKEEGFSHTSDWVHALYYRSPKHPAWDRDKVDWKRTYFGMHLVDRFQHATVNIVESEKTAIVMAVAYGGEVENIWLACGSKTNLTRDKLRPLIERGRQIILWPDRDAVDEWKDTAQAIGYERMSVNSDPVRVWWQEGDGDKADIADVVLRMIDGTSDWQPTIVADIIRENPALAEFLKRFDLVPI